MAQLAVSSLILVTVSFLLLDIGDLPALINARECNSLDIRNDVSKLSALEGCSVIRGFLSIALIGRRNPEMSAIEFSNLTFPELKEITDFFFLYEVGGLTDMKNMFPNLVVIRGRRLFRSYALSVSSTPQLSVIEFKSLIAIQRGHVFIGNAPKLCYLKKINWDRLTLTSGENHIFPEKDSTCDYAECIGCDYCWSNNYCQKFENANLIDLSRDIDHCHPQCLGGCYNSSNTGCNVCKGISDHGACVTKCPIGTYYSENFQRCYTKQECYDLRLYVFNDECMRKCPPGYTHSRRVGACILCATDCTKECFPDEDEDTILIQSLEDADNLRHCEYIRGNLFIQIGPKVEEGYIIASLRNLKIVQGYVKVSHSPYLKSLQFLQNLQKIEGKPLESGTFALVLYNNDNLQELWIPPARTNLEFVNGGIYSFANKKLCNKVLEEFRQNVIHNKDNDVMQTNDLEVLCEPVRLYVNEVAYTHNSVSIAWPKNKTAKEVEIVYREAKYYAGEQTEFDDRVCNRVHWQRELMFASEVAEHNSSHYIFNITNLMPNTYYDYLVKTFRDKYYYSARSPLQRFLTKPDRPKAPKLVTFDKSYENFTFIWIPQTTVPQVVTYYILETFEQTVDLETLDSRAYCDQPMMFYADTNLEDYDECCDKKREEIEDEEFRADMETNFACSVDSVENCHSMVKNSFRTNVTIIEAESTNITISNLKHYTSYTFFFFACNDLGCGAFYMHNDRTLGIRENDLVTNAYSCNDTRTGKMVIKFNEPPNPNGAVVSYLIQFHDIKPVTVPTKDIGYAFCISREAFHKNGYQMTLNSSVPERYNRFMVRVYTTAGSVQTGWFKYEKDPCYRSRPNISIYILLAIAIGVIALILIVWYSYHTRWWANIRFYNWRRNTQRRLRSAVGIEDEQELVPTLDTVSFRTSRDEIII